MLYATTKVGRGAAALPIRSLPLMLDGVLGRPDLARHDPGVGMVAEIGGLWARAGRWTAVGHAGLAHSDTGEAPPACQSHVCCLDSWR